MNPAGPGPRGPGVTTPDRLPHRRYRAAERTAPRAGRSRGVGGLPLGFVGMAVLVAAVESSVAGAGSRFLDPTAFCWSLAASSACGPARGCEVLLAGDSLVKHGLVPGVIREATGRRSYNLAVAAGPAPATEALLRRALDAGARPRAVVFDLKPGLLVGGPRFSLRYWPQVLGPGDAVRLALDARGGSFAGELLATSVLSSFRSRHEIRGDVLAALRGETGPLRALNALCRRNWTVNDGANLATPRPGYDGAVSEAEHERYLSRRFFVHRVNAAAARRIVALARERGARPYLLLPPAVPEVTAQRERSGAEAKHEAYVRSLQVRYPELTVLDARGSAYPPSAFIDPVHLSAPGALALSEDVGAVLRRDLDGGSIPLRRWVRLPPYRARPLPAGLEHVELSRARLAAATR